MIGQDYLCEEEIVETDPIDPIDPTFTELSGIITLRNTILDLVIQAVGYQVYIYYGDGPPSFTTVFTTEVGQSNYFLNNIPKGIVKVVIVGPNQVVIPQMSLEANISTLSIELQTESFTGFI